MVTRSLSGFEARAKKSWCGRRDLNPHGPCRSNGFSYPATAFAAPAFLPQGLGSGLSLHRARIGSECQVLPV
jgi:hypothetical protein